MDNISQAALMQLLSQGGGAPPGAMPPPPGAMPPPPGAMPPPPGADRIPYGQAGSDEEINSLIVQGQALLQQALDMLDPADSAADILGGVLRQLDNVLANRSGGSRLDESTRVVGQGTDTRQGQIPLTVMDEARGPAYESPIEQGLSLPGLPG